MKNVFRLIPLVAVLAAAGCTSVDQMPFQSKVDYRSGSDNLSSNSLEVPPDLSSPNTTNNFVVPGKTLAGTTPAKAPVATAPVAVAASGTAAAASTTAPVATDEAAIAKASTLPANQAARLVQAGSQRWLVVQGDPAKLWPEIRQFWLDNGFLLTTDNSSIGIMETDWQENRANLPQDIVTRMLRKIADGVVSTGLLDRFRTRVEQGTEPGTVEIYLTHQGMKEVYKDNGSDSPRTGGGAGGDTNVQTVWTPRDEDPELEAQMLALMLQKFGMPTQQAQQVVAAPVKVPDGATLTENNTALSVNDTYDRAWRRVGLALDRTGYVVFDRNRSEGVYFVKQAEADIGKEETSDGFMNKLAFWKKKPDNSVAKQSEFQVVLKQELNTIKVTVIGKEGQAADGKVVYDILSKLQTQLK
ncbi:outer membrane protein assembly factor BamC [Silvimonas terrae]|uniref:Outer membrane protein assembly factor BamC n=1 Tax=Silvimonas terrae TaxID=300266 RepID=A0A840RD66_9NEIS|nr:outer membrane protein assembly factor BamC [Silvimonas terrae]MBB5190252.1 outer membrane protein assembly factor BamC [Silvimonas terrae]